MTISTKLFKDEVDLTSLLVVFLFVGPLCFALLGAILGDQFYLKLNIINFAAVAALSVRLLLGSFRSIKLYPALIMIFIFFLVYIFRIIADYLVISYEPLLFFRYLGRFGGSVILPFFALVFAKQVDFAKVFKLMFIVSFVYYASQLVAYRFGDKFDYLTLGTRAQYSGFLVVLSTVLFYQKQKYYYLLGILLGCFFLFIYARKAPAIGSFAIVTYYVASLLAMKKLKSAIAVIGLVFLAFAFYHMDLFNAHYSETLIERGWDFLTADDDSTRIRLQALKLALDQFIAAPLFGASMFLREFTPQYPHNIFVEALMATGIVGSFFLFYYTGIALFFSIKSLLKLENVSVAILFLYFCMQSCFNGSLYWIYTFWISSLLIIRVNRRSESVNVS